MQDSVGKRLKDARLKMGLSHDQVYTDLKIFPEVLRAIEDDVINPHIGDVYMKGFLKKYADFLGFNGKQIISEFLSGTWHQEDKDESLIDAATRTKSISPIRKNLFEKYTWLTTAVAIILVMGLILYAGSRLVREIKALASGRSAQIEEKALAGGAQKPVVDRTTGRQTKNPKTSIPPVRAAKIPGVSTKDLLVLKANTTDKVWLRVKSDGKIIFESTLDKGSSKIWEAKNELELWVGRGDALKLTLNDSYIGSPGSGSIRSVIINHEGMKVRKK